jgi:hypothetical protein
MTMGELIYDSPDRMIKSFEFVAVEGAYYVDIVLSDGIGVRVGMGDRPTRAALTPETTTAEETPGA